MGWCKRGLIYVPGGEQPWLVSHASVPFAEPLAGGLHRIWFSPRDAQNRSHVTWLIMDLCNPGYVLEMGQAPVLGCGPPGAFDDCGAMMSWITGAEDRRRLYYIGWNTRGTVPFHVSIGLAKESPNGWRRLDGPVLDRGVDDPWFCSNPCVLSDGDTLRMWYLAGLGWSELGGGYSPSYDIAHARSTDGVTWFDRGRTVLPLEGDEFAIARPSVLRVDGVWIMWFCARTRTTSYRLGAACSADGLTWTRSPELARLDPSPDGWDSEMIAYPHVFEHAGTRWMLYCGNGFGRSGMGLAVWE
jgi:hypothetical protein